MTLRFVLFVMAMITPSSVQIISKFSLSISTCFWYLVTTLRRNFQTYSWFDLQKGSLQFLAQAKELSNHKRGLIKIKVVSQTCSSL